MKKTIDVTWDESPVDITAEANFIWEIANKLRGIYMPDKYGDVIIPMVVIRRFECSLEPTKQAVVNKFTEDPNYPPKAMYNISGHQFYNTSKFTLKELLNDADNIAANFSAYISGFSENVRGILEELEMEKQITKMDKEGCLYSVIKAFSELDLSPETYDSIKMGYIFENLIGRFFQNVDAGQFYTGRDIIKLLVSIIISEGCDDIFDPSKVITVCDQACGTGGMLSTTFNYIKHYNPSADIHLFGQEFNGVSHAIGLAEMLIKGQRAENFRHADTLKTDCFRDQKMRFIIMNPPFGTPWSGKNAKDGQSEAVYKEYEKGFDGRWGAGLPESGDSQLLFIQSAISKLDDNGRAAIISNGSPLFSGNTTSGESQIRRWLLENDLIEAIILLPTDLFYNTGIATYVWVISKNKRSVRKGKVQLIDASAICHKLRKPLGFKKNEFSPEDRSQITRLYNDFVECESVRIFDNTEFLYRQYEVLQPLQRSYSITKESIENMLQSGSLSNFYDSAKVENLELKGININKKDQKNLEKYYKNKPIYNLIIESLNNNISDKKYMSPDEFMPIIGNILSDATADTKLIAKIADGLSVMDKDAEIQTVQKGKNKGDIIYDSSVRYRDSEIVRWDEDIEDYMAREVLSHIPDAKWFYKDKVGAEIPFTRYFYKYQQPTPSEELELKFTELEVSVSERIKKLFGDM